MPVYSYSPSKTVFISEMKYTASQFTLIHCLEPDSIHLALVVQTLDSAIYRINHYPADKYYGNELRYPLDSDLSGG